MFLFFFFFVQGSACTEIHSSKQMIKFSISMKEYHLNIVWAIMFSQHATKNIPVNGFVHQYSFQWCFSEDVPYFFCALTEVLGIWNYVIIGLTETNIFWSTSARLLFLEGKKKTHYWKLITLQNLISVMGTE